MEALSSFLERNRLARQGHIPLIKATVARPKSRGNSTQAVSLKRLLVNKHRYWVSAGEEGTKKVTIVVSMYSVWKYTELLYWVETFVPLYRFRSLMTPERVGRGANCISPPVKMCGEEICRACYEAVFPTTTGNGSCLLRTTTLLLWDKYPLIMLLWIRVAIMHSTCKKAVEIVYEKHILVVLSLCHQKKEKEKAGRWIECKLPKWNEIELGRNYLI